MYGWRVKVYANDIKLSSHLTVWEEDILLDRKDASHVRYLSSGMDCGARAAAVDSGQILETP
jgi:hypothetical protein